MIYMLPFFLEISQTSRKFGVWALTSEIYPLLAKNTWTFGDNIAHIVLTENGNLANAA